jgi:hypothetical protein
VAEVGAFLRRENFAKLLLHLLRLLTLSKTQAVSNADAMGIADHAAGHGIEVAQK